MFYSASLGNPILVRLEFRIGLDFYLLMGAVLWTVSLGLTADLLRSIVEAVLQTCRLLGPNDLITFHSFNVANSLRLRQYHCSILSQAGHYTTL